MVSGKGVLPSIGLFSFSKEGSAFCKEKLSPALRVAAVAAVLLSAMAWMGAVSSLTPMGAVVLSFTASVLLESILGDRYGKILKNTFPSLRERAAMVPPPARENPRSAAPLPAGPSVPATTAPTQNGDQNLPPSPAVKSPAASSNGAEQAALAPALPASSSSSASGHASSSQVPPPSLNSGEKPRDLFKRVNGDFSKRANAFALKNKKCASPLNCSSSSSSSSSLSTWFAQNQIHLEVVSEDPVGFVAYVFFHLKLKLSVGYTLLKAVRLSEEAEAGLAASRKLLSWLDNQKQSPKRKQKLVQKAAEINRKVQREKLLLRPMQRDFDPTRPSFQLCIDSGLEDGDAEPLLADLSSDRFFG